MRLYLTNETPEEIMPLVDQLFDHLLSIEHMCTMLDFLPRSLTAQKFVTILEKEKSKRSAQVAKANLQVVEEMKLDDNAQRKLYLLMHECLGFEDAFATDSQRMLLKYLSTFAKVGEGEVEEKACLAIINTLKLPIWQFDEVSDLVPIRGLAASKSNNNKQLAHLFDIFCFKGFNEYQNFYSSNKDLVDKTWDLCNDTLTEKIRMLSLCRIAQERRVNDNDNSLTYSQIAAALSINEEEVEAIIIRAVGLKLMSARVDQVKKVVRVGFTHHAMFTHDQWKQLQEMLSTYGTHTPYTN